MVRARVRRAHRPRQRSRIRDAPRSHRAVALPRQLRLRHRLHRVLGTLPPRAQVPGALPQRARVGQRGADGHLLLQRRTRDQTGIRVWIPQRRQSRAAAVLWRAGRHDRAHGHLPRVQHGQRRRHRGLGHPHGHRHRVRDGRLQLFQEPHAPRGGRVSPHASHGGRLGRHRGHRRLLRQGYRPGVPRGVRGDLRRALRRVQEEGDQHARLRRLGRGALVRLAQGWHQRGHRRRHRGARRARRGPRAPRQPRARHGGGHEAHPPGRPHPQPPPHLVDAHHAALRPRQLRRPRRRGGARRRHRHARRPRHHGGPAHRQAPRYLRAVLRRGQGWHLRVPQGHER